MLQIQRSTSLVMETLTLATMMAAIPSATPQLWAKDQAQGTYIFAHCAT